jgi:hypothetical protein
MFQPLDMGCGSESSLDLDSMTLWIRIPNPDSEQENCMKKIYSKKFVLKLNVNVKHTLHYAMHTVMEGVGGSVTYYDQSNFDFL